MLKNIGLFLFSAMLRPIGALHTLEALQTRTDSAFGFVRVHRVFIWRGVIITMADQGHLVFFCGFGQRLFHIISAA